MGLLLVSGGRMLSLKATEKLHILQGTITKQEAIQTFTQAPFVQIRHYIIKWKHSWNIIPNSS